MNDYERVASVIRYLDQHYSDQPDLSELARGAGLSPFHFHRLFSAWAGVTPKDFLQCLTLEHVKMLLRDGANVLDAALNVGLSGPGRLHDLCVTLEAASPGELKSGGGGTKITYGFADTPFGEALIAETTRGICHLSFINGQGRTGARDHLSNQWPEAKLHRNDQRFARAFGRHLYPAAARQTTAPLARIRTWDTLSGPSLAGLAPRPDRFTHHLWPALCRHRSAKGRSRSRWRRRRESDCLCHSVSSRHSRNGSAWPLSLGSDSQTRHDWVGNVDSFISGGARS